MNYHYCDEIFSSVIKILVRIILHCDENQHCKKVTHFDELVMKIYHCDEKSSKMIFVYCEMKIVYFEMKIFHYSFNFDVNHSM